MDGRTVAISMACSYCDYCNICSGLAYCLCNRQSRVHGMTKHKTFHDLVADRIGEVFALGLVASDLRQNHIDAADKVAAGRFLIDERRHRPNVVAAALQASSTK